MANFQFTIHNRKNSPHSIRVNSCPFVVTLLLSSPWRDALCARPSLSFVTFRKIFLFRLSESIMILMHQSGNLLTILYAGVTLVVEMTGNMR